VLEVIDFEEIAGSFASLFLNHMRCQTLSALSVTAGRIQRDVNRCLPQLMLGFTSICEQMEKLSMWSNCTIANNVPMPCIL
jgi:hypothetical protein